MENVETTENIDTTVDSILNQLKNSTALIQRAQTELVDVVTKENLEKFVIDQASNLIKMSASSLEYIKDIVQAAPTPDDICAMADMVKSSAIVIDILNKIVTTERKIDATFKLKEMEIQSKKEEVETKVGVSLVMSREELMKQLMDKSKIIDADKTMISVESVP